MVFGSILHMSYIHEIKFNFSSSGTICSECWLLCRLQAARVTDAADKLKDTGPLLRARPLQYMNTPQLELDSYITLTQAVRLRVGHMTLT